MKKGLCLDHEPGNSALIDRCNGFEKAIEENSEEVEYLGRVEVPLDNAAKYKKIIEDKIGAGGSWDGIALFLLGPAQTNDALNVKKDHSNLILGSVDTSDEMYTAIKKGDILFGITQGPYMQGYMPIPMLTWLKYTGQSLNNQMIESGPTFVEEAPSEALQFCEKNLFKVCPIDGSTPISPGPGTGTPAIGARSTEPAYNRTALIVCLVVIFGVLFIVIGFIALRVRKLNKHIATLEKEGKTVPDIPTSQKMASVFSPVESVVSARMA